MLGVQFFEPLCPCEDKMSIKKVFHFWPSEIAASMCGQSSHDGPYRLCTLAAFSTGKKWKTFLMLILSSRGHGLQKSALPTLFHFVRVSAALQPHVTKRQQLFKSVFSRFSGLFGNSATSEDGSEDRDERQRDFDVLSPKAQHKDICGRRFVRQGRIVGGGIAITLRLVYRCVRH